MQLRRKLEINRKLFQTRILQKTDLLSVQVRVSEIKPIAICKVMCKILITWLLLNEDLETSIQTLKQKTPLHTNDQTLQQTEKIFKRWINLLKLSKMLLSSKMTSCLD
jgi:hypothetical protein